MGIILPVQRIQDTRVLMSCNNRSSRYGHKRDGAVSSIGRFQLEDRNHAVSLAKPRTVQAVGWCIYLQPVWCSKIITMREGHRECQTDPDGVDIWNTASSTSNERWSGRHIHCSCRRAVRKRLRSSTAAVTSPSMHALHDGTRGIRQTVFTHFVQITPWPGWLELRSLYIGLVQLPRITTCQSAAIT